MDYFSIFFVLRLWQHKKLSIRATRVHFCAFPLLITLRVGNSKNTKTKTALQQTTADKFIEVQIIAKNSGAFCCQSGKAFVDP